MPVPVVSIEITHHKQVPVGETDHRVHRCVAEGIPGAAGSGGEIQVEEVYFGVVDCGGDSLYFEALVLDMGGVQGLEADGVVD